MRSFTSRRGCLLSVAMATSFLVAACSQGSSSEAVNSAAFERGQAHLKQGEYRLAIVDFTEDTRQRPNSADAYEGLAEAWRSLARNTQNEEEQRKAENEFVRNDRKAVALRGIEISQELAGEMKWVWCSLAIVLALQLVFLIYAARAIERKRLPKWYFFAMFLPYVGIFFALYIVFAPTSNRPEQDSRPFADSPLEAMLAQRPRQDPRPDEPDGDTERACPHCGRVNSARTRICPRCENHLSG